MSTQNRLQSDASIAIGSSFAPSTNAPTGSINVVILNTNETFDSFNGGTISFRAPGLFRDARVYNTFIGNSARYRQITPYSGLNGAAQVDNVQVVIDSGVSNGVLTQDINPQLGTPGGGFSYNPNAGFTGTDSFTYHIVGSVYGANHQFYAVSSNEGTVTFNVATGTSTPGVTLVNVHPVDTYVDPNSGVIHIGGGGVFQDINVQTVIGNTVFNRPVRSAPRSGLTENYDQLTVTVTSGPANGTLVQLQPNFQTGLPGGEFDYTPNKGFVGTDSFTYQVTGTVFTTGGAQIAIAPVNGTVDLQVGSGAPPASVNSFAQAIATALHHSAAVTTTANHAQASSTHGVITARAA